MADHGRSILAVLTVCLAGAASPVAEQTVAERRTSSSHY